ncbi:MAG: hypothetical protein ACYTFQ_00205 [Planctomycetota bacterium]|jgi:hypothetical protein
MKFYWNIPMTDGAGKALTVMEQYESADEAKREALKLAESLGNIGPFEIGEVEAVGAEGYIAEVIADNSGQWVGNGLTFATVAQAHGYVSDLSMRWFNVRETRVIATDQEPTHFFELETRKLGNLERPEEAREAFIG